MRLYYFSLLMNLIVVGGLLLLQNDILFLIGFVGPFHFVIISHFLFRSKTRKIIVVGACLVAFIANIISYWKCGSIDLLNCDSDTLGVLAIVYGWGAFYFLFGFFATQWVVKRTTEIDINK